MAHPPGATRDADVDQARSAARRARRLERFYFTHPPLLIAALALGFEWFTRVSLLYTTIVSAVTAAATYGAKAKAADAEAASFENPPMP